ALRGYPDLETYGRGHQVVVADGRVPAWRAGTFGAVVADVPCTGLGSLRRRPESRWRRDAEQVDELTGLQAGLLASAIESTRPGGVVAYITCSPHPAETVDVVAAASGVELLDAPALLPEVPDAASRLNPRCIQLWPHIHGTDAMFCALLRRSGR
ncbi:MAG: rRNA cytosine-C5-methylase, partial [Brooklawnia sp.]